VEGKCELGSREKQQAFNSSPGIFAVLLGQEIVSPAAVVAEDGTQQQQPDELRLVPLGFAYVDCSTFLIETGKVFGRGQSVQGIEIEIEVSCSQLLIAHVDAMPLEPLLLDLGALGGYPMLEDENIHEASESGYVYGKLVLGGALSRMIMARPLLPSSKPASAVGEEASLSIYYSDENNASTIAIANKSRIEGQEGQEDLIGNQRVRTQLQF